jgi:hypothetical protein
MARCAEGRAEGYRRRNPEATVLYGVLAEHLETFLARSDLHAGLGGLPVFVARELRRFLTCGVLAHGFARLHCVACGKDQLIPFSCKGRGFCPSCGGRRMADTAAHLVDRVIPGVPVRQWVLTFPWRLRFLLASDPELCRALRSVFLRAVFRWQERRAERMGLADARSGAVNFVQRFSSSLALNPHLHALVLDGVYTCASPLDRPVFHALPPPTDGDVAELCRVIRDRTLRLLERRGLLDSGGASDTDEGPSLLDDLAAASVQGRVALGDRAGRPVLRIGSESDREPSFLPGELCAELDGFSLHAKVRTPRGERDRLERLARYVARPALSTDRLSLSKQGNVMLHLRRPWRDGTTRLVFEPLTFLERLAALIPRPRTHLVTYHGVLAPAASWRDMIVPGPRPERLPGGRCSAATDRRYSWPELLRRVFAIDVLRCGDCGARRRVIALIMEAEPIQRILTHLGLAPHPPPVAPARPLPELDVPF